MCDLETSRIGAPYIYDISNLRVNMHLIVSSHLLLDLPCGLILSSCLISRLVHADLTHHLIHSNNM